MIEFGTCLGFVAPWYNLVLVAIIIPLFIKLLSTKNKKIDLKPWRILFFALSVYVVEEVLTVINSVNIVKTPRILTSVFELFIISFFIYMLLVQKELNKKK